MRREDIINYLMHYDGRPLTFMEVCGTHTAAIAESGIMSLLSERIRLISGPGCPVCVTVASYIDRLICLAKTPGTCVVTFGDMMRVRGSVQSLRDAGAEGACVRMVYAPFDVLEMAQAEPETLFVFAAVGFETTAPIYALLLEEAIAAGIDNIRLLTALKTMPAVISRVCEEQEGIDGFLAPGHVSVITGSKAFLPLAERYQLPFVVTGFEGEELLAAVYTLVKLAGTGTVKNLYRSAVKENGNEKAIETISEYFEPCDAAWRGFGVIPNSGIRLKERWKRFDAGSDGLTEDPAQMEGCLCAQVITGKCRPFDCPLFGTACTPEHPVGACMVSVEGACFHYHANGIDCVVCGK